MNAIGGLLLILSLVISAKRHEDMIGMAFQARDLESVGYLDG